MDFIVAHPSLKQYLKPLENVIFVRLLQQLSQVFQVVKLSELSKLAYFVDATSLEKSLVDVVRGGFVDARIDHTNGVLRFGTMVCCHFVSQFIF